MSNDYNYNEMSLQPNVSDKGKFWAIILCLFLGNLGIHRFYLGRYGSGAIILILEILGWLTSFLYIGYLFLAISLIWVVIDFFRILFNGFPDAQGRKLK